MRRSFLFALALWCFTARGGDGEFYRQFLNLVDTNQPGTLPVRSPLLTDTNNIAPKLTNSVVNLNEACSRGEIGGARLAMTMEEVAESWGKPQHICGRWCFGGPIFFYEDASIIFDPSSNSVTSIIIHIHKLPRLHGGLSASSSADQFEAE